MKDFQREFLDFALATGVLRFGEFKLKSGRSSPYFFNSGLFNSGASIANLGRFYAAAINQADVNFDMLFGPAYKGIPLAVSTSIALATHYGKDTPYAFNRKEAKNHGEGGWVVGAPIMGRILIIDDVISAGTSVRESITLIENAGATAVGVAIALDRKEKGLDSFSAIQEIEKLFNLKVTSIVTLDLLVTYLESKPELAKHLEEVAAYQNKYGV